MTGLSSYAELADVTKNIGLLVRETRRARQLSLRTAATQIGVDLNTLRRIEIGNSFVVSDGFIAILRWLDRGVS